MQKWEYFIKELSLAYPQSAKRELDALGAEGWELVEVCTERVMGTDTFYAVFKRPL